MTTSLQPGFYVAADPDPEMLLVEPIDHNDIAFLHRELDFLHEHLGIPFAFVGVLIEDWFRDLTPWPFDPVMGKESFGDRAPDTLNRITGEILPYMEGHFPTLAGKPRLIGGYSLAGLFSLWAGYESDYFDGIAAASPSVWYPGWMDYARSHQSRAKAVYLSLGDEEPKARNKTVATVGDAILEQAGLLDAQGVESTMVWNVGNHFNDADIRTAKAFKWAMERFLVVS